MQCPRRRRDRGVLGGPGRGARPRPREPPGPTGARSSSRSRRSPATSSRESTILDAGCATGYSTVCFARPRRRERPRDRLHREDGRARARSGGTAADRDRLPARVPGRRRPRARAGSRRRRSTASITTRVVINLGSVGEQAAAHPRARARVRPGGLLLLSEATVEGLAATERAPSRMGSARRSGCRSFNLYLERGARSLAAAGDEFVLERVEDFASSYFVATRVLKPILAQAVAPRRRRRRPGRGVQPLGLAAARGGRLRHPEALRLPQARVVARARAAARRRGDRRGGQRSAPRARSRSPSRARPATRRRCADMSPRRSTRAADCAAAVRRAAGRSGAGSPSRCHAGPRSGRRRRRRPGDGRGTCTARGRTTGAEVELDASPTIVFTCGHFARSRSSFSGSRSSATYSAGSGTTPT